MFCRTQLQEACQLLEHERRQYRELRRSLSKAGEAQLSHSLSQVRTDVVVAKRSFVISSATVNDTTRR